MDCLGSPTTKSFPGLQANARASPAAGSRLRVLGEEEGDLHLQGVGVLELVHEDVVEAALEVAADGDGVGEDVAGAEEEVLEVDHRALALGLLVGLEEAAEAVAEGPRQVGVGGVLPGSSGRP